jgi:hypothetical protein
MHHHVDFFETDHYPKTEAVRVRMAEPVVRA